MSAKSAHFGPNPVGIPTAHFFGRGRLDHRSNGRGGRLAQNARKCPVGWDSCIQYIVELIFRKMNIRTVVQCNLDFASHLEIAFRIMKMNEMIQILTFHCCNLKVSSKKIELSQICLHLFRDLCQITVFLFWAKNVFQSWIIWNFNLVQKSA